MGGAVAFIFTAGMVLTAFAVGPANARAVPDVSGQAANPEMSAKESAKESVREPTKLSTPTGPVPLEQVLTVAPGASCLQAAKLVRHVRTWLGRSQVQGDLAVRVVGDARDEEHGTSVAIKITRGADTSHRAFEGVAARCEELHAIVGLAVALGIDANALRNAAPFSQSPPKPARLLSAGLSAGTGLLIGPSLGLGLGAETGWLPWLSTRLDVDFHHAWGARLGTSPGRFDQTLLASSLQLCAGGQLAGPLRVAVCTGPSLGLLRVRGRGFSTNSVATGLWFALRTGIRLALVVGIPWTLEASLVSPILSPSVRLLREPSEAIDRKASSLGCVLTLGPAWSF